MGKKKRKDKKKDYEVGYGRPPKHSQFKKGQSGNPSGREKEPTTFLASFNKELSKGVKVIKDGKETIITGLSAVSKKCLNMILSGDYRSMKMFLDKISKDVNIEPYLYPDSTNDEDANYRSPAYIEARSAIRAVLQNEMSRRLAEGETLNQNKPPEEE